MEREPHVVGKYRDPVEVKAALQRLERDGYTKQDISLYSSRSNFDEFEETMGVDMHTTDDSDRSFWEEIKNLFNMDDDRETDSTTQEDFLTPYLEDIDNGYTVITVRNYTVDTGTDANMSDTKVEPLERDETDLDSTTDLEQDTHGNPQMTENEKIQLKEERLQIDKEEVQTGEVHVTKQTVHDTETIEVPVEREEIVVEKESTRDDKTDMTDTGVDEETGSITIPVKEEKVNVDKDTVVAEEVEVKKEHKQDVEHVTEDVRKEKIDVETNGDVQRKDTQVEDIDWEDPDRPNRV